MSDKFVMSARQAAELDHAFERSGYTPADVKRLSQGNKLGQVLPFLKGLAKIEIIKHVIDLDLPAFVPKGWRLAEDEFQIPARVRGQFEWIPEKVLQYLSENQKDGKVIVGYKLREELLAKPVLPANVLDYLLVHPELIPEKWKGRAIFFWGTIYRDSDDDLVVRCLYWSGRQWDWGYSWLVDNFDGDNPAASLAS